MKSLVAFLIMIGSILAIFSGANTIFANNVIGNASDLFYSIGFVIVGILGLISSILLIIGKRKKFLLIFWVISVFIIFAGVWLFFHSFSFRATSVTINGRMNTRSVLFYISMMLVGGGILGLILSFLLTIGKAIANMLGNSAPPPSIEKSKSIE